MVQSGVMHKGVDLKFEITSSLSLTDSGFIRLHPTKVRVLGVNGESLLHALGMKLDNLLDLSGSERGTREGRRDLPRPDRRFCRRRRSRADSRRCASKATHWCRSSRKLPDDSLFTGYARADSAAPNYLFFRGGRLRFGRLEMRDTQLQILDLDPSDPFDLYPGGVQQAAGGGVLAQSAESVAAGVLPGFHGHRSWSDAADRQRPVVAGRIRSSAFRCLPEPNGLEPDAAGDRMRRRDSN